MGADRTRRVLSLCGQVCGIDQLVLPLCIVYWVFVHSYFSCVVAVVMLVKVLIAVQGRAVHGNAGLGWKSWLLAGAEGGGYRRHEEEYAKTGQQDTIGQCGLASHRSGKLESWC